MKQKYISVFGLTVLYIMFVSTFARGDVVTKVLELKNSNELINSEEAKDLTDFKDAKVQDIISYSDMGMNQADIQIQFNAVSQDFVVTYSVVVISLFAEGKKAKQNFEHFKNKPFFNWKDFEIRDKVGKGSFSYKTDLYSVIVCLDQSETIRMQIFVDRDVLSFEQLEKIGELVEKKLQTL